MDDSPQDSHSTKGVRTRLKKHYNSTLLSLALGDSTPDDWKNARSAAFDKAKKTSDLIGFFIRLGFAYLSFLYFSSRARSEEFWLASWSFGICAIFSLALYALLFLYTSVLISIWWMADTAHWKSKWGKWPIFVLGVMQTLLATYGISSLAKSIATASTLLK